MSATVSAPVVVTRARAPYAACALIGLGGLFFGVTGPLVSTFVPPLLALASASWTLPTVNAYPLFVEPVPAARRGILAALFLLAMALGGAIGDPLNGILFDWARSYRPLFLLMATYSMLALVAMLRVGRGTGEADAGVPQT